MNGSTGIKFQMSSIKTGSIGFARSVNPQHATCCKAEPCPANIPGKRHGAIPSEKRVCKSTFGNAVSIPKIIPPPPDGMGKEKHQNAKKPF